MKQFLHINQYKDSRILDELVLTSVLPQWKIIHNSPNPDVVFVLAETEVAIFYQVIRMRMKFGWKPLICMIYGEPGSLPQVDWLDYTFSHNTTDSQNCRWTLVTDILTKESDIQLFNSRRMVRIQPKTHFCNFIYRNAAHGRRIRNSFCQQLMQYKPVDCPGKVMNNMPSIIEYGKLGGLQAKLDFIANYKFTIAFENTSNDYYISEKIVHPLMAGSIPIYWGCLKIAKYFNPECFINCHDYDSFSQVIERIKEVDNDPKLYQKYIDANPILPNSYLHETKQQLTQKLTHITKDVLQRRKATHPNKLMSLWKVLMLIWGNKHLIFQLLKIKNK